MNLNLLNLKVSLYMYFDDYVLKLIDIEKCANEIKMCKLKYKIVDFYVTFTSKVQDETFIFLSSLFLRVLKAIF